MPPPLVLPAIPDATMCYKVEVIFYGHSPADQIGVRPVLLDAIQVWAKDARSADGAAESHITSHGLEYIKTTAIDVEKNIIREKIINDPEFSTDRDKFMRK
jgi:hypothetical protein